MDERQGYAGLLEAVSRCAAYASDAQAEIRRTYKADGSVLTKTDLYINTYLTEAIRRLFPDAGIISEESAGSAAAAGSMTFVIDPIDGTDVYSQGFPSWSIAVGMLDGQLNPVGGIVSAPRWGVGTDEGLLIYRFPGDPVMLNGRRLEFEKEFGPDDQLIISSGAYKRIDFSGFKGKIRSFGSTILHMVSPLLFSHVQAALISSCFIWDVAAAHGIIAAEGLEIAYLSGAPFAYGELTDRSLTRGYALVGTPEVIEALQKRISLRPVN